MDAANPKFITLARLGSRLGLPRPWLKAEAEAGRIPHLKVGDRIRFDPEAVEHALTIRTAADPAQEAKQ